MKFRFVDQITSWQAFERISGIKAVSFEEYCLKEAFGDEPRLPETLVLESFLQLGNWLILLSTDFRQMGMVVRLSEVRFHRSLLPGQALHMQVTLSRQRDDGFELCGEGFQNGQKVISGLGCLAVPHPAEAFVNVADLQVLFSEIYHPNAALVA